MIDWILAGTVILSGMVIVFLVLILLIEAVVIMGRLMGSVKPAPQAPAVSAAVSAAPVPVIEAGIPQQTVAVISAAVAACMEEAAPGAKYAVTSIGRKSTPGARPVWGFAGMRQNTEPF